VLTRPTLSSEACEATILVSCPDQMGVVAALSQLLFGYGVNIISSDQFSDMTAKWYFQRLHIDFSRLIVGADNVQVLETALNSTAKRFDMKWSITYKSQLQRVAVLVSKLDHCLYDLLIRNQSGELPAEIAVIISNHATLEPVARQFGIPFRHLPMVGEDKEAAKAEQEAAVEALINELNVDLIVLARYMQVLSTGFCLRNATRTINIHHSFLPAFEGGRPYHRAHDRGVKIIGATAHYATAELDAGPIIEQDVTRITHRESVTNMVRKGKDLERLVLARAVRAHLESRVIVFGNRTVVFEENA